MESDPSLYRGLCFTIHRVNWSQPAAINPCTNGERLLLLLLLLLRRLGRLTVK
jgi:hypothetical protein